MGWPLKNVQVSVALEDGTRTDARLNTVSWGPDGCPKALSVLGVVDAHRFDEREVYVLLEGDEGCALWGATCGGMTGGAGRLNLVFLRHGEPWGVE